MSEGGKWENCVGFDASTNTKFFYFLKIAQEIRQNQPPFRAVLYAGTNMPTTADVQQA
jgi:hypothetical protein